MNIKPILIKTKNNKINKYKIFSKNFIFIILFLEFIKNINNNVKCNYFVFKKRKHIGSFLRAPYKNKIAQFSLGLIRYFLIVKFNILLFYKIFCSNKNIFNNNINLLLKSYKYFESTLITQVYRLIRIPISINLF